jgi:hypothetical protein
VCVCVCVCVCVRERERERERESLCIYSMHIVTHMSVGFRNPSDESSRTARFLIT